MIRRWSSKFGKDRKTENGVTRSTTNGTTNGTNNGANGHSDSSTGAASTNGTLTNGHSRRSSTFGFHKNDKKDVQRKDIEGLFQEFAQLIHASKRPIPNQNGDGTYNGKNELGPLLDHY